MQRAMGLRAGTAAAIASALLALWAAAPDADARWVVKGRGFGHGVGMSQYGAFGLARQGRGYRFIIEHYFTRTRVRKSKGRLVNVLLDSGVGSVPFTRAEVACGRILRRKNVYEFLRSGSDVLLRRDGHTLDNCGPRASAQGRRTVNALGYGVYRGRLIARLTDGTMMVLNQPILEDYLKGVIANEMSPSWPRGALRAQAVAARSYAIATDRSGPFDHYDDSRSQVYGGRRSETKRTNHAVNRTRHQVGVHDGKVITAFFFSSSGGMTESIQFGFAGGGSPEPYLKAVEDPFDKVSPFYRWTVRLSDSQMEARLAGLFSGNLRRIDVIKRGRSPRIVRARVVGSNGSTKITGPALQSRLGTRSTWMKFREP
jgi:stage II sporulation protein D